MIARVRKFVPGGSYGFLTQQDGTEVFFHLWVFDAKGGPPPIVGEMVTVEIKEGPASGLPRADRVVRAGDVRPRVGSVTKFDPTRGYGFISDPSGDTFYLHKSDVAGSWVPTPGSLVQFYVASYNVDGQRPRACHVTPK